MLHLSEKDVDEVSSSFGRCCMDRDFFDSFYDRFLKSSSLVANKFKNTEMEKQKLILRGGITTLILFSKGMEISKINLKKVAISHSREKFDISPKLYPYWKNSLIATIRATEGDKLTPDLEKKWNKCLDYGLNFLKSFY